MTTQLQVSHWDEWLNHPQYLECHQYIRQLYKDNSIFTDAMDQSVQSFLQRQKNVSHSEADALCRRYLFEEYPIFTMLWPKTTANYLVYPKERTQPMKVLSDHLSAEHGLPALQYAMLKFNNKKMPRELSFPKLKLMGFYDKVPLNR